MPVDPRPEPGPVMDVSVTVWVVTVAAVLLIIGADLVAVSRRPHLPTFRESVLWVLLFIGLAVVFGLLVWAYYGQAYAGQFYAGWLTEYSLSLDNLFVFVIIMSRFKVPASAQQTVLLIGILLALFFRSIFIVLGAAAIAATRGSSTSSAPSSSTPRGSSRAMARTTTTTSRRTSSSGSSGASSRRRTTTTASSCAPRSTG